MNARTNVASLLSFVLLLHLSNGLNYTDPCRFDLNTKGIIDLTSVGHVDGTPAWKSISPEKSDGHVYSYNPCHPFSLSTCINVASCQIYATNEKLAYSLGTQDSIEWKVISGQDLPTLLYASTERKLTVELRCLNSGEPNKLEVHGYDDIKAMFTMTLSSKCACWNGCKGEKNGLGGGAIIIIVFVILIIIYLIVFTSYNKFKRQATGIAILPHHTFWISLPGYSLDGVKFIFRKVTGKETGYNAVP